MPLHARLEGRLVPTTSSSSAAGAPAHAPAAAAARLDRAHAAVIDNFVSEEVRAQLLSLVVFGPSGEEWGQEDDEDEDGGQNRRRIYDELSGSAGLPRPRWERRTADSAEDAEDEDGSGDSGRRRLGWGLSSAAIDDLLRLASPPSSSPSSSSSPPPRALAEVGSKLCAMFPEHDCLWLPTESMEGGGRFVQDDGEDGVEDGKEPSSLLSTSPPLLANAASSSDAFSYHVDCDPDSSPAPGSPWHRAYGHYANGEPNSPLLVSLVLYLNESWRPAFAGETLLIDSTAGVGCAVLPRPRRALLLESDVLHKVCPPSSSGSDSSNSAGNRLRFSLVFKLALCPKRRTSFSSSFSSSNNVNVLSRDWWGLPADLGSAKALSELVRRVGEEKKKRKRGEGKEEEEQGGSGGIGK